MSNIYIQEPPTNGKVILHTTVGPIDIELWSKETPKACRNFVQLCLENYYDGTMFHRLIKGMCVQGGDPTGTGEGGDSIYGKPFKDEFHSRLRFTRRGLVAMATNGKHDNASQFFFTLGATPHLNNKHTIFGKVAGNTIYNMIKLEDGDVNAEDRPEYPQKIRRTEVVDNPFPDIVPREKSKSKDEDEEKKNKNDKVKKDFKLLSFGDEAEEEDEELNEIVEKRFRGKSKSSHDLLKNDKTLSAAPAVDQTVDNSDRREQKCATTNSVDRIKAKLKEINTSKQKKSKKHKTDSGDEVDVNVDNFFDAQRKRRAKKQVDEIKNEIKKLKREMKSGPTVARHEEISEDEKRNRKESCGNDLLASFYAEQEAYSKQTTAELKKSTKGDREARTLAILEKFKAKLHKTIDDREHSGREKDDDHWLSHELRFSNDDPVLAKDATTQKEEMYDITDPRHPLNARKRQSQKHSGTSKHHHPRR